MAATKAAKQQAKREREARKAKHIKLVKALKGLDSRQMNLFSNLVRTVAAQGMIIDVRDGETEEQAVARVKGGITTVANAAAPAATTGGPTDPPEPPKEKPVKKTKAKKEKAAPAPAPAAKDAPRDPRLPRNGTVLTAKYKGKEVSVTVQADGFKHGKKVYPSLSKAACAATDSPTMNGFRFFGLDKKD